MWVRSTLNVLPVVAAALSGGWGALAIWYQFPGETASRWIASIVWAAFVVALIVTAWVRRTGLPIGVYALCFMMLLAWWSTIAPSNHRDWADDVARSMTGDIDGSRVTLHNVRDFNWRSETDYDIRWETRQYDLDRLSGVDVILSSWGMPGIVHALMSFGFDDGSRVVLSVEVRRQRDKDFSSIGGFFKHFERTIVAADESDVIRLRTNVRGETDHLYHLQMSKQAMRALFVSYIREANELTVKPAFYNTATSNCVSIVYDMAKQIDPKLPYDYRLLLTAYLPSYLYQVGALDKRYPLAVLTAQGDITMRARATKPGDDFSRAIRTPPEPGL
ncbi:DUF4105 domain-containing protein [Dyella sp. 2HG41-7]|uniref:Lnb N-terminal periplasmic domain-containing protein n=1 Tax=Dyella sp. 2HG41-7 TaxID=2883239 RepID=UPI001F2C4396|nr:DUF4105 domain-containing protein [Dyella sp. 2HG41-7]